MTLKNRTIARALAPAALLAAGLGVAGCNSTPPRPAPAPQPQTLPEPPPPPPQARETPQPPQAAASPPPPPAGAPTYLPPSADAAEVQVEEIPVDGEAGDDERQRMAAAQAASAAQPGGADARPPAGGRAAGSGREELARASGSSLPQTPEPPDSTLVGPRIQLGAQTEQEQIAALDAELGGRLAEFDELMRRARAAAEAEKEATGGSPAGTYGGRGGRYESPPPERGAGGAAATGTGLGNTPDLTGETGGQPRQVATTAPPPGIPDGRDDDIVARQLREAATKEADPVLREKLWEEYRKYKAGL